MDGVEFRWLKKRGVGVGKKDINFYESFIYDGMDYTLFDCVYLYGENEPEPHIGKIIKIWELPNKTKLIKTLWFFRPSEISNWLKDDDFLDNELFLACGQGVGLANINTLETVAGKCNVICTSKDLKNPQPSEEEVNKADYTFCRAFDVGLCKIIDTIEGDIASVEVRHLFNRKVVLAINKSGEGKDGSARLPDKSVEGKNKSVEGKDVSVGLPDKSVEGKNGSAGLPVKSVEGKNGSAGLPVKSVEGKNASAELPDKSEGSIEKSNTHMPIEKRKSEDMFQTETSSFKRLKSEDKVSRLSDGKLLKVPSESSMDDSIKNDGRPFEITRRLDVDKNKWFRGQPWEERMQSAHRQGSLLLIENLDLACTSEEVEDIIWHGFRESCTAKMLLTSTYYKPIFGHAFVVLKTRESAENIISRLDKGCLMLSNGRPLVASIAKPCFSEKLAPFVGHISIDDVKLLMQRDLKLAVSTSHCSQPNTIEYEMAMDWCLLQARAEISWKLLNRKHEKELEKLTGGLKFR